MESFLQNRPSLAIAGGFTPRSEGSGDFQPFLRPASPQEEGFALASTGQDAQIAQPENEPKIELVDREGCVERIVITCSCCKQIELKCEY
jgi:hypothetical protein